MRRLALTLLMLLAATVRSALAVPASTPVTYVSGSNVYLEIGALQGVQVGDTLQVFRDGKLVARLRTAYVSSKRAACDTLWTASPPRAGDEARYDSRAAEVAARADSVRAAATVADSSRRAALLPPASPNAKSVTRQRLRGRVGARWLSVNTTDGASFRQPALDVRLDGRNVAQGRMDLSFDMRNRRTTRNYSGGDSKTDQQARVYRATVTLRTRDSNRRITVGRQSSPLLASVHLFDGGLIELGDARRTVGVFSGTQPDPVKYSFSGKVLQYGGFAEWHQAPRATDRWSFALGAVSSQENGQPNRDFAFAQSWWFNKRFSASFTQEVDFNRGWKRAQGEPALSTTSTFGSLRVPVTAWLSANGGYDNRRNVRLYRDRLTPETQFDDAYRQGAWAGAQLELAQRVRLTGEARSSAGADRSHSWSGSGELMRFAPLHATARARYSKYFGQTVTSSLWSGGLGLDPVPQSHLEMAFGERKTEDAFSGAGDSERWESVDVDWTLGRNWYVNGGFEQGHGGLSGTTRQVQAGLSWRF
ncbi:MAG: hypothetical protein U0704_11645 [Candidatus Eisenbacteria bacterium]